jgi:S-methylmethionine-dependent homocysteine/selenocysteine methylase
MHNLSKSPEEFFKNSGWSAKLFLNHAKAITNHFGDEIKVGRTVVYIKNYKIYVHYNGRSKEYMTICDHKGNELHTFHYLESSAMVLVKLTSLII